MQEALQQFGDIVHVKLLKHKFYGYVEFAKLESASQCVEFFEKTPLIIKDQTVTVFLTCSGKQDLKPLDLNPPSKILLLTFFKNKVDITVGLVVSMLNQYELVDKIIIYEK